MQGKLIWVLTAVAVFTGSVGQSHGGDVYKSDAPQGELAPMPPPAQVQSLSAYPDRVQLKGGDDAEQLVLTATLPEGRMQDLSADVKFDVADPKIVRVTSTGRVLPLADGRTEIVASYGPKTVKIPVSAEAIDQNLPINFANQIVPVLTKLGCNGGGCHGKASGQNGFKLSLLGFEPDVDFTALVKEARGRRLFPAAPDHSLMLLKATGQIAHGGGKRMEIDSDEYKLIRRWIAAGTPYGQPTDPFVDRIMVYPDHRIMTRQNKQQLAVYAHYTDGSVQDITRRAQYESNDTEIAVVDPAGLVRTLGFSGEAAVMARYQGQVTVFRATVPLGQKTPSYQFPAQTLVDAFTQKKWQQLGLVPSEVCSDAQVIRRVSLDITGTLPTPAEVTAFVNSKDPAKRDKLVDSLLENGRRSPRT